jgi:hypothetical protein
MMNMTARIEDSGGKPLFINDTNIPVVTMVMILLRELRPMPELTAESAPAVEADDTVAAPKQA